MLAAIFIIVLLIFTLHTSSSFASLVAEIIRRAYLTGCGLIIWCW